MGIGNFFRAVGPAVSILGGVLAAVGGPYAGIGFGLILAGAAMTAAGAKPASNRTAGNLINVSSSRSPLRLIYGEMRVGVNKTYYFTEGKHLHIICELGEGPIYGIKREDGTYWTTTASQLPDTNPPLIYFDDKLWTNFGSRHVYMEFFSGSATQTVCTTLQTATGGEWDQALRYTAYLYVRLESDNAFQGEPSITATVRGITISDPTNITPYSNFEGTNNGTTIEGGWTLASTDTGEQTLGINTPGWCVPDINTVFIKDDEPLGGAETDHYSYLSSGYITAVPGQRYCASIYSGAHRCRISLYLQFYDSSYVYITGNGENNDYEIVGGIDLSSFKRLSAFSTAPANSSYVRILALKYQTKVGYTDSYGFFCYPKLSLVSSYDTLPGDWTPGVWSTSGWTDNPALHAFDLMTRSSQRGGLGINKDRIDNLPLAISINYCIAKGWTCNLPIDEQAATADNLEYILACYRGTVIYSEAKFKFRFADLNYESYVMALDESDIISGSLKIELDDQSDRPNALCATYIDASKLYKQNDLITSDQTAITAEGDYREQKINLFGLNSSQLVQKMSNYLLERERLRKTISFSAGERCKALEPYDLITLTHSMPGWSNKYLRVISANILPDHTVSLSCIDEDTILYDDIYNLTTQNYHDTNLLDPNDVPPDVTGVALTETVYAVRLRTQSRLDVTLMPPASYPWFDHVEVWVSIDGAATWKHQFNATDDFSIDPVEEGKTYILKLVTVNIFGIKPDFADCPSYSKYIDGKSDTAPESVSSLAAIFTGNALNIYSDKVTDDDVELYEFRLGASWSGGLFLSAMRAPNLSLNGVKPGVHTIWLNTLGTNGIYGDSPQSVSVVVPDPPRGWTITSTFGPSTVGTGTNSSLITYNSSAYIEVNHSTALSGSWQTEIYDSSTSKQYLAYIQNEMTVIGIGSNWSDMFPSTALKWSDVLTTSQTWADGFSPEAAPTVRMKLNYGDATSLGSTIERLEILSGIVTGRYFRASIDIVDPQPGIYGIVSLPIIKLAT